MMRSERRDLLTEKGQTFGRYRLRGVVGEGGMGRLYVAEQTGIEGFSKLVALKRILPHLADSPQFRGMFLNEARVAARLEHPNIVATYELGEVEGTHFIAMEYLPGEDLGAILARQPGKPIPVDLALALALQAGNGLEYAHELRDSAGRPLGLVHRDVNPSNIFVTYYGMVKLLDFGVVKGSTTLKTSPGVFKGKYAYCAPEQLTGDSVDRRTDVFCLGIVLWECLTGKRLFDGDNDAHIIDSVRSRPIPMPSALDPSIPKEIDQIVSRALSRARHLRFQSALELVEAIERFLGARPSRPTSKNIGLWLESLFGSERAQLKKAIAQGSDLEAALQRLAAVGESKHEPRAVTGSGPGPAPKTGGSTGSGTPVRSSVRPRALWSTNLSMQAPESKNDPRNEPKISKTDPYQQRPSQQRFAVPEALEHESQTSKYATMPEEVSRAGATAGSEAPTALEVPLRPGEVPIAPVAAVGPPARGGSRVLITLAAVAALAVVGTVLFVLRPGEGEGDGSRAGGGSETSGAATGALDIKTQPPGAHIFVDGDPSGIQTPAVLRGLKAGRTAELRLVKEGYEPVVHKVTVAAGEPRPYTFKLVEAAGIVRLEGLPARATVFVDDRAADPSKPLVAPLGPRRIRVEVDNQVVFSRTVEIHRGEQTFRVLAGGSSK